MKIAHHNGRLFSPVTIKISTCSLPPVPPDYIGVEYETCAFVWMPSPGLHPKFETCILERYETQCDAVLGHAKWCAYYGVDKPC